MHRLFYAPDPPDDYVALKVDCSMLDYIFLPFEPQNPDDDAGVNY